MRHTDSPLLELYLAYDQWKEEHDTLHERLLELCRFMKWNPSNYEYHDWDAHHSKVSDKFIPFMRDWKRHLAKERKTVYPIADSVICGGGIGPVAVLEQDVRIADLFYEDYLQSLKEGTSPEDSLCKLLQVLMIIAEHFRVEDEAILPVTVRLMDEIEYGEPVS